MLQRYKELQDIIVTLDVDELSEEDTIRGFKAILAGEHDTLPEQAFYMVGASRKRWRRRRHSRERHAPLRTTMKPGQVWVQQEAGEELLFWVGGGALEVQPHKVTVLADTAARTKDLDQAAALAAKQRAEEALRDRVGAMEIAVAQAELARAAAQLRAIGKLSQLRKGG